MQAWLRTQRHWLVTARLPAYAPDLDPVEALRSNLKAVEFANLTQPDPGRGDRPGPPGLERVRNTPHLAYSFLRHAGLSVA